MDLPWCTRATMESVKFHKVVDCLINNEVKYLEKRYLATGWQTAQIAGQFHSFDEQTWAKNDAQEAM